MPIGFIVGRECPPNCVPVQARLDVNIVANVAVIIVVDERMMAYGIVKRERGNREKHPENERLTKERSGQAGVFLTRRQQMDLNTPGISVGITRKSTSLLAPTRTRKKLGEALHPSAQNCEKLNAISTGKVVPY